MVLQTERYPGGYHQNSYSAYQGPNGSYSNFQDVSQQTTPYSGYQSTHASQQQSGWSTGGGYPGNGGSHYPGSGLGGSLKPTNGGYGGSHGYGNPHGQNHVSPHGGHGSPHGGHGNPHGGYGSPHGGHGYGGPQGYGNSHGYGSGKPTHGLHGYSNGSPYGHAPNGYQKPSWDLKGIDSDDE